jgi:hypothetical protein
MSGVFQKNRELDIKMIELGVGILRAGPQETGMTAAREWAIDLIQEYSGLKFSDAARTELLKNALPVVVNTAQNEPASSATGGWAAVGFLQSSNQADHYFTTVNGDPLASNFVGQIIKAKISVNVRPGPASWNAVNFVLSPGQCFFVYETRTLLAGSQNQTWARGDASDCTPSK